MSDKQKPETASPVAPQEVNDETLDQVNGGWSLPLQFGAPDNTEPARVKVARN